MRHRALPAVLAAQERVEIGNLTGKVVSKRLCSRSAIAHAASTIRICAPRRPEVNEARAVAHRSDRATSMSDVVSLRRARLRFNLKRRFSTTTHRRCECREDLYGGSPEVDGSLSGLRALQPRRLDHSRRIMVSRPGQVDRGN